MVYATLANGSKRIKQYIVQKLHDLFVTSKPTPKFEGPSSLKNPQREYTWTICETPTEVHMVHMVQHIGRGPKIFSILPRWFRSNVPDGYMSCFHQNSSFTMQYQKSPLITAAREELDFPILEVRLLGTEGSLFSKTYPSGIELTNLFKYLKELSQQVPMFHLYPMFLYYTLEDDSIPYEKETMYISLLMDETFDVEVIRWDECRKILY